MKKIFFFLLGLLSSCSLWAETVHVETPGTLKELLMDLEFTGTQLTLTGTLNAADLSFIHDGKGRMENVEELDISQIKVMPSDESYANGSVSYVAGDNFLPKAYFYYSTECYCDTTRTTDMLGRGHVTYKIHDNNLAGLFLDNASYKKVILPSWLKTIGKYMFQDSNIENCVFPEVYKEIEDGAFINSKISSITLPKECKSIGKLAFHGSKLKTIDLTYVSYLGKSVFAFSKLEGEINLGLIERVPAECFCSSNITSIKFSKNLKTIGEDAFNCCEKLESIEIPQTFEYIGYRAFPEKWVKTLQPESGVYYIGNVAYAFAESAKSMPNIKFKEGTIALSSNLYASQDYIQSTVTTVEVPSSVKQIGDAYGSISSAYGIFANCTSLQTVLLPKGLESIADRTFSDCTSLKNITIPNSLQYVGNRAFDNVGITSLTLGENMKAIGYDAFNGCTSLITVRVNSKELRECYATFKDSPIEKVTFGPKVEYVPALLKDNASVIKVVFEEDDAKSVPLEIGDRAFYYCTSLKFSSLPHRLTKVGKEAFRDCI